MDQDLKILQEGNNLLFFILIFVLRLGKSARYYERTPTESLKGTSALPDKAKAMDWARTLRPYD